MATSWRERDYSRISEHFTKRGEPAGNGWLGLYVLISFAYVPFILPAVVQLFVVKARNLSRGAKLLSLSIIQCFSNFLLTIVHYIGMLAPTTEQKETFVTSIFLLFLLMVFQMIFAVKAVNENEISKKCVPIRASSLPKWMKYSKVFGMAGQVGEATVKFGFTAAKAGEEGEVRTAEMLEPLLRIPGTRIFHGMQWPGSRHADVDHIVVNGNKIVLIDSKLWSGIRHSFNPRGEVISMRDDGGVINRGQLKFPNAVDSYAKLFSHDNLVIGWIGVHASNGRSVETDNSFNPAQHVPLQDAQRLVERLGDWIDSTANGEVKIETMDALLSLLK